MRLSEAVSTIIKLDVQIEEEKWRHENEMRVLNAAKTAATEIRIAATAGMDTAQLQLAETVLYVKGDFGHGDDYLAVQEAIKDIAEGCTLLRQEYIATKNYGRWYHQGTGHPYGFGPKHGYVVFEIGLVPAARNRKLTPAEADAAIYYLSNLFKVYEARKAAKETADK